MNNSTTFIENRLLANESFLKLDRLLNRFNIFDATDMGRQEIKHTKFLAFLLDPNESHGLGDLFIRNFVTRISESYDNFPSLLDFDFLFAVIKSEQKLAYGQIDILIEVPLRREDRTIVFAIENKIDSSQSEKQLAKYSDGLAKKYLHEDKVNKVQLFKLFLTFTNEDPHDDSWVHITYKDTIISSVKNVIDIVEGFASPILISALKHYVELIVEDVDGDQLKDELAKQIFDDRALKTYFDSHRLNKKTNNKSDYFGSLEIRYKKSINYLCSFDSDIRSGLLNTWSKRNHSYKVIDQPSLNCYFEKSNRTYFLFNILTEVNRTKLIELSNKYNELDKNACPIGFILIVRLDDKQQNKIENLVCKWTLEFRPLDNEIIRKFLVEGLFKALNDKKEFGEKNYSGQYSRLIPPPPISNLLEGFDNNLEKWVNINLFEVVDESSKEIKLKNKQLEEYAITLNKALDKLLMNLPEELL